MDFSNYWVIKFLDKYGSYKWKNMRKRTRELNIPIAQIKGFVITGKLYRTNKRFILHSPSFNHAMMINLWNGSVWAILDTGKRKLLKRIIN